MTEQEKKNELFFCTNWHWVIQFYSNISFSFLLKIQTMKNSIRQQSSTKESGEEKWS